MKELPSKKYRSPIWQMDKDKLEELVNTSLSFSSIIREFGLISKGGNIRTLKNRLDIEGINYSHIKGGKNSNKGRCFGKRPVEDLLHEKCNVSRAFLKMKLIESGVIPYVCKGCGQEPVWEGKNLVLVLDHINGVCNDNRKDNLQFLCPNCNSQTPTFSGRNKIYKKRNCYECGVIIEDGRCFICDNCKDFKCSCGSKICSTSSHCQKCSSIKNRVGKIERPTKEVLQELIKQKSFIQLGKDFGVSGNAIRKWCKSYGIDSKPYGRGYWAKIYSKKN
jgi:hypothetical protein